LFREKPKDKFQIIQEVLNRNANDFFEEADCNEFFFNSFIENKFDFEELKNKGRLKFSDEYRIGCIKELVEVEYGNNFNSICCIGRTWWKDLSSN